MGKSKKNIPRSGFENIFIENDVYKYDIGKQIIKNINSKNIIKIKHYKDIFNVSYRDYDFEKKSPSLILAVNNEKKIYKGSLMCNSFGFSKFYYLSIMKNCLFDCEYCYLQGMYNSGHIVLFVNFDDYVKDIELKLGNKKAYLSVSYDTDMLALEKITGYSKRWHEYAKKKENIVFENRTKSINIEYFKKIKPIDNMIYSFSLLPHKVAKIFEKKTSNIDKRINFLKNITKMGFMVRICIDPIIYIKDFEREYLNFIEKLFKAVDKNNIIDINLGFYRMPANYYNTMIKKRPENYKIDNYLQNIGGYYTYNDEIINKMREYIGKLMYNSIENDKVIWHK